MNKQTIHKMIATAAVCSVGFLSASAMAGQDESQRQIIQRVMKAKQKLKQADSVTDNAAEVKAPAASMKADKAAHKKMKPHSHVEEKIGVQLNTPEAMADKPSPNQDMSKHYHPRDGK